MTKKELLEKLEQYPDDAVVGYLTPDALREVSEIFQTAGTATLRLYEYDENPSEGNTKLILFE